MTKKKSAEAEAYQRRVNEKAPRSDTVSQCFRAFLVGGLICCIGQAVKDFGASALALDEDAVSAFTSIVLVFLGALLTGIGVYDRIGAWAGAGSIVPITGFSNSIVAPAMEFKREGLIMGVGAKLFTFAGPVLVNGISVSVIVGLLTCLLVK